MMDIGSTEAFPSGELSNFAAHEFVFDGIRCASMEGLLQALKFKDATEQVAVCSLVGKFAKRKGRERNETWKSQQTLWWQDQAFARTGDRFQRLLDRAFSALATNEGFRTALLATGTEELVHTMGCPDPQETVLTEEEFCSRLMLLRNLMDANLPLQL